MKHRFLWHSPGLALLCCAFELAMAARAQGTIVLNNRVLGWSARVSDGRTGEFLEGRDWLGQMYYSPIPGSSEAALVPVPGPAVYFATGFQRGWFDFNQDLTRVLPDVIPGTVVPAQFRAWNAAAGETFEKAAASPIGVVGKSDIGRIETGVGAGVPGTSKELTLSLFIRFPNRG